MKQIVEESPDEHFILYDLESERHAIKKTWIYTAHRP